MISQQSAHLVIDARPDQVRAVLLDPLALPTWNPAFLGLTGSPEVAVGETYRITVPMGLSGTFTYTGIEADRIDTRWSVPGFTELGSWHVRPYGARTEVVHNFGHRGALAAILVPAYRNIAELRLDRLRAQVAASIGSSSARMKTAATE
ncbi:SRPBCC family protein [Nocardia sp. KC 131]|uniref:SRPBCC family protein n=1 Tax=Nocardia arseniciresistens TaxID=3392119 RepID=UPI00398E5CA9